MPLADVRQHYELEDYQSGVPRWCTGCGDNAILAAVQRLCRDEDLRPEKTIFVSGIGCSSRFPHYMKTYGFHGIHGRALPVAEGIKMARPDMDVFVNTGDGDCCSIGAAHWIHAIRYNMNMTVMLHDNQIYGLTKKQASPTSPRGTEEQYHAARQLSRSAATADGDARRSERVVRRTSGRLDTRGALRHHIEGRLPSKGSRSSASFSVARNGCRTRLSRGCKIHTGSMLLTHEDGLTISAEPLQDLQEPGAARSIEHQPRARDRLAAGPDSGRHPLSQPGCSLLRSASQCRAAAHAGYIKAGLDAELDKFTIWPQDADSNIQPSA